MATMFYVAFGLILGAFFVLAVFLRVQDALGDSSFHKRFYSRDLALLVDALHAGNGRFIIDYDINPPDKMFLDVSLEPDNVFLTDRSDKPVELRSKTMFRFGYNEHVVIQPVNINNYPYPYTLKIITDKNTIAFRVVNEAE